MDLKKILRASNYSWISQDFITRRMTLFCKEIIRLVVLIVLKSQSMRIEPILKKQSGWRWIQWWNILPLPNGQNICLKQYNWMDIGNYDNVNYLGIHLNIFWYPSVEYSVSIYWRPCLYSRNNYSLDMYFWIACVK